MLYVVRFVTVILLLFLALIVACGNGRGVSTPSASAISPIPDTRSYLEKQSEDIGVKMLPDGHLKIWAKPHIAFLRLLAYWNAQSHAKGENGIFYPYKVAGAYEVVPQPRGDRVHYEIHFSDDDFGQSPDLEACSKTKDNVSPYAKLDFILTCLNGEATAKGREYKVKAWYEGKEKDGALISDTLYAEIQFSFDMPRDNIIPESAISARTYFPLEEKQNVIIARTAVELAQVLTKGEELAIIVFDFVGPIPSAPEWVYIFKQDGIERLKGFDSRNAEQEWRAILENSGIDQRHVEAERPSGVTKRAKEPISDEEIEIVARIAVETARIFHPTLGITVTIYEFKGRAPKDLTTWVYIFDGAATKTLGTKELTPKEVLEQAKVVEQQGALMDGRPMPPIKPILREAGK